MLTFSKFQLPFWCVLLPVVAAVSAPAAPLWAQSVLSSQHGPQPVGIPNLALGGLGASSTDSYNAQFTHDIAITVPSFYGIEPRLSLHYSSQASNGILGVGWSLRGVSTVTRLGGRKGSPTYLASDIFFLDGQELFPCAAGSLSPSCHSGGTHSTKIENYLRIQQSATTNTWTITGKDGTQLTYAAVYAIAAGNTPNVTFRWGLAHAVDTHGNRVDYTWACTAGDCYPNAVAYNLTTVTFHRELRPDPIAFATGGPLGKTSYRLKTIDVQVGGARARSYSLVYAQTAKTGQSLLASVREYGQDAVVAPSSTNPAVCGAQDPTSLCVVSGTSLPASGFHYAAEGGNAFTSTTWTTWCTGSVGSGDFNGDGRKDLYCLEGERLYTAISNGLGKYTATVAAPAAFCPSRFPNGYPAARYVVVGDIDGDGKDDAVCYDGLVVRTAARWNAGAFTASSSMPFCAALTGWGPITPSSSFLGTDALGRYGLTNRSTLPLVYMDVGDFNGDGKADLFCKISRNTILSSTGTEPQSPIYNKTESVTNVIQVGLSKGDGTFAAVTSFPAATPFCGGGYALTSPGSLGAVTAPGGVLVLGDFNGDGKTDFACHNRLPFG